MTFTRLFVPACLMLGLGAACNRAQPASVQQSEHLKPTASIKEIMLSIVDPSADVLWESVETVVSAACVEEHQPRTQEEWDNVRRHAIALIEAPNLLVMPGRRVAPDGHKSEFPGIELEPEEMEKLIADDRATFERLAGDLRDAVMPALEAIDKKDAMGLSDAGERIDTACENCHLKYWYPNGGPPPAPPNVRGS
jgi:hypothetical protein